MLRGKQGDGRVEGIWTGWSGAAFLRRTQWSSVLKAEAEPAVPRAGENVPAGAVASAKAPSVVGETEEAGVGGKERGGWDCEVGRNQTRGAWPSLLRSSSLFPAPQEAIA